MRIRVLLIIIFNERINVTIKPSRNNNNNNSDVEGDKWSNAEYEGIQYNTPSSLSLMSPKKYIIALEGLCKKR